MTLNCSVQLYQLKTKSTIVWRWKGGNQQSQTFHTEITTLPCFVCLLTPAPSHPHTVSLGIIVLQQLDQVIFVVVKLNIGLRSIFAKTYCHNWLPFPESRTECMQNVTTLKCLSLYPPGSALHHKRHFPHCRHGPITFGPYKDKAWESVTSTVKLVQANALDGHLILKLSRLRADNL